MLCVGVAPIIVCCGCLFLLFATSVYCCVCVYCLFVVVVVVLKCVVVGVRCLRPM